MPQRAKGARSKRGGVLFLALPQAPDAAPGTCRWCGEKLKGKRAKIRRYCYKDREGRDCVKAYRDSMVWNPRAALRMQARKEGKTELRCVDCGFVVELLHRGRIARQIIVPWEADHEIELWDGGEHTIANLRVRCVPDHRAKTARESARRAKLRAPRRKPRSSK